MCRLLLPMVVFCFSKRRVDALADNLGRLNLATAAEKSEVLILLPSSGTMHDAFTYPYQFSVHGHM